MISSDPLNHIEGERIVENLKVFNIEDLMSKEWNKQRENIYRLNVESHRLCQEQKDDYLLSLCVLHSKVKVLIHELILIELWKSKVGLLLKHEMIKLNKDSLKPYFINFHESNLTNLLELYFFDKDAFINEDVEPYLNDIVDFCFRKFTLLVVKKKEEMKSKIESAKDVMNETEKDIYEKQVDDIDFKVCVSSLAIFRYMTDHISSLPPSVVHRILDTHDMVISLIYLLEKKPWERMDEKRNIYRFEPTGKWRKIPGNERFKLCTYEAQVFLAINNLLLNPETMRKYEYNHHRKETVLLLSKHLTEVLVDQIPILDGLRKYIAQLQILTPPTVNPKSSLLLIEQVAELRESILKETDFEELAKKHREILCSETKEERMEEVLRLSKIIDAIGDQSNLEKQMDDVDKINIK